ncbi:uncharacterized protein LOC131143480 [Malania oleifera]|uniref:uncharacterized protein LOC131143480 n=1 Tax=Malania oleifera TaxID=397392 RepID=UPI0025ADE9FB|nr:uncharacterized protein LOC131143480 [Malania oleifera]
MVEFLGSLQINHHLHHLYFLHQLQQKHPYRSATIHSLINEAFPLKMGSMHDCGCLMLACLHFSMCCIQLPTEATTCCAAALAALAQSGSVVKSLAPAMYLHQVQPIPQKPLPIPTVSEHPNLTGKVMLWHCLSLVIPSFLIKFYIRHSFCSNRSHHSLSHRKFNKCIKTKYFQWFLIFTETFVKSATTEEAMWQWHQQGEWKLARAFKPQRWLITANIAASNHYHHKSKSSTWQHLFKPVGEDSPSMTDS